MLVQPDDRALLDILTREEYGLVLGLRGQKPPLGIDWDLLGRLAEVHGVGPLLHNAWKIYSEVVPAPLFSQLQQMRYQFALRGALALKQRDEIVGTLDKGGIPSLVLKGAALAERWYGDLSLRPFADIDLLVPERGMEKASHALMLDGYETIEFGPVPHHELPLAKAGKPCAVELHHRLTARQRREWLTFDELYERRIELDSRGTTVRTLSPEDHLLFLCTHTLQHVFDASGWSLRHLFDIARHIDSFDIDWQAFEARAEDARLQRACAAVLGAVGIALLTPVPADQVDEKAALQLLRRPIVLPEEVDEELFGVYSMLSSLTAGGFRRALSLLFIEWVEGKEPAEWTPRARDLRRGARRLWKLVRGLLTDGRLTAEKARAGVGLMQRREAAHRLVCDLLDRPYSSDITGLYD